MLVTAMETLKHLENAILILEFDPDTLITNRNDPF